MSTDQALVKDAGALGVGAQVFERGSWKFDWQCEKWEQDKVDHVLDSLLREDGQDVAMQDGKKFVRHNISGRDIWRPVSEGCPSDFLREFGVDPDDITVIEGNLLLNEGIGRLLDLLTAAGGVAYNNANAFCGVGDTNTAEAATQTDLSAATNKFYKGMNATYPVSPGSNGTQSRDWRSDFTTTEANYAWAEWTVCAGATSASGAGFTVGTTNLNRKVQSLGTKTTGTWTLTATITIA